MVLLHFGLLFSTFAVLGALASPRFVPRTIRQASITDMKALTPFTQFARAAYCRESKIRAWDCEACAAIPNFKPSLVGGDGSIVQNYFVGHWPEHSAVVVAHQGTDPLMLIPVLTDLNILRVPIDPLLFPGAPPGTKVHWGFQLEHERSAERIKLEVAKLMELHKVYKIYTIGHSLGGALAILDALFLSLQFPAASVETIVYGAPRVGNQEFATFVDSKVHNLTHPVPVLPPKWLGFKHPQGELHFAKSGSAVYCDGEDNEIDTQCEDLTVHEPFALTGNVMDHMGPYEGIHIGSIYC